MPTLLEEINELLEEPKEMSRPSTQLLQNIDDLLQGTDQLRVDGTTKGPGFLGELKRPDGRVSTELSVGISFDGRKDTEIPLLVPILSKDEIDYLLSGKKPTKKIIDKAVKHAKQRMRESKSPFYQEGEPQPTYRPQAVAPERERIPMMPRPLPTPEHPSPYTEEPGAFKSQEVQMIEKQISKAKQEQAERQARLEQRYQQGLVKRPDVEEIIDHAIGQTVYAIGSMPAGFSKGIAIAAKILEDNITGKNKDIEDYAFYRYGKKLDDYLQQNLSPDPRMADSFVATLFPRGVGSGLGFMVPGKVASLLGGSRLLAMMTQGAGLTASEQYERAKQAGASEDEALTSAMVGGVIGLSEALPFERVFRRFNMASGGTLGRSVVKFLKEGAIGGFVEAVQETFAQVGGNAAAKIIHSKEQDLFEGWRESLTVGGSVGALFTTVGMGAGVILSPSQIAQTMADVETKASQNIASKDKPSRKDFEKAGINGPYSETKRIEVAQRTRELKDARKIPEDQAVAEEARQVAERGQTEGLRDIQRPERAGPEAGQPVVPQETQGEAIDLSALSWKELHAKAKEMGIKSFGPKRGAIEEKIRGTKTGIPEPISGQDVLGIVDRDSIIALEDITKSIKKGYKYTKVIGKRAWGTNMPSDAYEYKIRRDGMINRYLKEISFTVRDFNKALKKDYGSRSDLGPELIQAIDGAVKGEIRPEVLPDNIRNQVVEMRNQIDALSRRLIDIGAVEGEMVATFEKNMGFYVHRTYRAFRDPSWSEKVPQEVRSKAKALFRQEHPDANEEEIQGLIESLLYKAKESGSPMDLLARAGKEGSKDLSILKRRKNIPPEIRALFGEYKEPRINYALSVIKMSKLIANHQFLTEVRNAGMGKYLFEKPVVNQSGEYVAQISAKNYEAMKPLDGLYTTPEIARAFSKSFESPIQAAWMQNYMKILGIAKFMKTVGSWKTHVRNYLANPFISLANGRWISWGKFKGATKGIATDLFNLNLPDVRKRLLRWRELHVVGQSARAGEINDVLQDASNSDISIPQAAIEGKIKKAKSAAMKGPIKLYGGEDDFWKFHDAEVELARYHRAMPEVPIDKMEERIARIIRRSNPTYAEVPPIVKFIRRFPLIGPFVSFHAEILRNSANTLALAAQEIADPRLRHIGLQRATGFALAVSVGSAIAIASRYLTGVSKDEDDDLRRFIPEWSENSQLLHLGKNEDGKYQYIDLSYTDPHEILTKPALALLSGDDWQSAIFKAIGELARPFISEELITERLLDLARNQKKRGGEVYNPQDDPGDIVLASIKHVFEPMEPGISSDIRRIRKGLVGYINPWGGSYNPKSEITALMLGLRVSEIDIPTSLSFKMGRYQGELRDIRNILYRVVRSRGKVTDEEIVDAYQTMTRRERKLFDEMHETINAAQRLGVTQEHTNEIVRASGMSKINTKNMLEGIYVPYKPSNRYLSSYEKRSETLPKPGAANAAEYQRRRKVIQGLNK